MGSEVEMETSPIHKAASGIFLFFAGKYDEMASRVTEESAAWAMSAESMMPPCCSTAEPKT